MLVRSCCDIHPDTDGVCCQQQLIENNKKCVHGTALFFVFLSCFYACSRDFVLYYKNRGDSNLLEYIIISFLLGVKIYLQFK